MQFMYEYYYDRGNPEFGMRVEMDAIYLTGKNPAHAARRFNRAKKLVKKLKKRLVKGKQISYDSYGLICQFEHHPYGEPKRVHAKDLKLVPKLDPSECYSYDSEMYNCELIQHYNH